MPQIRRRSKNGLTSNEISKIQIVTSNKGKNNSGSNDPPNEPGRCKICLDGIKGQHYKTKKNKSPESLVFALNAKNIVARNTLFGFVKSVLSRKVPM